MWSHKNRFSRNKHGNGWGHIYEREPETVALVKRTVTTPSKALVDLRALGLKQPGCWNLPALIHWMRYRWWPGVPVQQRPPWRSWELEGGSTDCTQWVSSSFLQGIWTARMSLCTTILKAFLPASFIPYALLPLLSSLLTCRVSLFMKYLFILDVICRSLWSKNSIEIKLMGKTISKWDSGENSVQENYSYTHYNLNLMDRIKDGDEYPQEKHTWEFPPFPAFHGVSLCKWRAGVSSLG